MRSKTRILFMSASLRNEQHIEVVREAEIIRECLRRSQFRDNIEFYPYHCTTVTSLQRALLDAEYDIVHISGHGAKSGIVLNDSDGKSYVVPPQALAKEFQDYSPPIRCIILNACYSVAQGRLISMGVPFTIAMNGRIDDCAALLFSERFYDAIGAGRDIEFAYDRGCNAVALSLAGARFSPLMLQCEHKANLERLHDGAPSERINIAKFLGSTRQVGAIAPLAKQLENEADPEVRYWLIIALGQMRNQRAQQILAEISIVYDTDKLAIEDAKKLS